MIDAAVRRELLFKLGHARAQDKLARLGDLRKRGAEVRQVGLVVFDQSVEGNGHKRLLIHEEQRAYQHTNAIRVCVTIRAEPFK